MAEASCGALTAAVCVAVAIATLAFLRAEEAQIPRGTRVDYIPGKGWLRESVRWDAQNHRFLVSYMEGGLGQVAYSPGAPPVREHTLVPSDAGHPVPGISTNGFHIDHDRNRVVAAIGDASKFKFSAVAAYDIGTWKQIFYLKLAGTETRSLADDVAIDPDGNIYVTDAVGALIWKVRSDGSSFEILTLKDAFKVKPKSRLLSWVTVNGIVYHPEGFLLVVHTGGDCLFRVSLDGKDVRRVDMGGSLLGDGIALASPSQLAVAGLWTGVRLVESKDAWSSANITHFYASPRHRIATSVTVKDGAVFVNYLIGYGIPYLSTIGQAAFKPITMLAS